MKSATEKTTLEKYYLLIFYFCFLLADCALLYQGKYGYRLYAKPAIEPILLLWFMSNTAFNMRSSPQTITARLLLYAIFLLTLAGDVCGLLASDKFTWTTCLFTYSFTYLLYFFLFLSIQKNAPEEKVFFLSIKKVLITFLIVFCLGLLLLNKGLGLSLDYNSFWLYTHALLLAAICGIVANMWGLPQLKNIRPLFMLGMFFLLITNAVYSVDELVFHRTKHILDVIVACSNGLTQIFVILGVIKFLRYKKG